MAGPLARRYPRGVTHDELRTRLRPYADGTLEGSDAELVRTHLATGCPECLRDVFARPIGLPRAPVVVRRTPWGLVGGVAAGAAVLGTALGVVLGLGWDRPSTPYDEVRVTSLALEVDRLRAEHDRDLREARERAEREEAMRQEAAAAPPPPPAPPARDRDMVPAWLADLLASDGARVVPLEAAPSAVGARGYVVWSPARHVVVVSATALPVDANAAVYRVRVTLHDGSTVWVGDVPAPEREPLLVTVEMPEGTSRRVTAVDLFRDPPGQPALSARVRS